MVAAWIRALIGVGPAMAFGSQKYNGPWADLAAAATNKSSARNSAPPKPAVHCGVPRVTSAPHPVGTMDAASSRAPSPTALAARACRLAPRVPGRTRPYVVRRKLGMLTTVQLI